MIPAAEPGALVDDADAELLQRLQAGDEAAFAELVDRWSAPMLRVALSHTRMRALAEEAVQETWLAVLQGLDRFEGRASLKTWVFRILLYTCRAKSERERRVPPLSDLLGTGEQAVPEERFLAVGHPHWPGHWSTPPRACAPVPDAAALDAELGRHIMAAVAALPARHRDVLVLRDVEGWSSEEVCLVLGLTPANQRLLLHRARSAVRARLEPYLSGEGA